MIARLISLSALGIAGADIDATCDNLVNAINNNSNGFIRTGALRFS
jgi:hypothetical protein